MQLEAARKEYDDALKKIEGKLQSTTDEWEKALSGTKPKKVDTTDAVQTLREELSVSSNVLDTSLSLLMEDAAIAQALADQEGQKELRRALTKAGSDDHETQQHLQLV